MRGSGNVSVGSEMKISAARKVVFNDSMSVGTMETLASSGVTVPFGAAGIVWAVRTEVNSWIVKRMLSVTFDQTLR